MNNLSLFSDIEWVCNSYFSYQLYSRRLYYFCLAYQSYNLIDLRICASLFVSKIEKMSSTYLVHIFGNYLVSLINYIYD